MTTASDLPASGFRDSIAMARSLVSYIDCPHRVQRAIRLEFDQGPCLRTIERFRREYLAERARPAETPAFHPHDGYWPGDASRAADWRNREFLARLQQAYPERFAR